MLSCDLGLARPDFLVFVSIQVLALGFGLVPEGGKLRTQNFPPDMPRLEGVDLPRQMRWAKAAFRFISTVDCRRVTFTTNKECQRLTRVDLNMTNLYLALPSSSGDQMVAVFPESSVQSEMGRHDGVLAVDPYPAANFGHLVLVFYVDLNRDDEWCKREDGIWLKEDGDCIQLALQKRCKNSMMKRKRRRNFARRCEINFLPLVHFLSDKVNRTQRLVCRPDLGSTLPCPVLQPISETTADMTSCDPLRKNTKRCETSHENFESACHVIKICDQAVILSGGWNPWSMRRHHVENVHRFYRMLRKNGFHERNIKVFYADGRLPPDASTRPGARAGRAGRRSTPPPPPLSPPGEWDVHPATEAKMAMRYQTQRLCSTMHCVDSLVLYLNSPSTNDGSTLLWDSNHDGVAGVNERYSLDELMSDLVDCQARHLHVIVDQSYSGNIIRAFRRTRRHPNVMVYTSSKDTEYSFGDDFSRIWTQVNHTTLCTKAVFKKAKKGLKRSVPQIFAGDQASNVNIYGAPCDVRPPLTQDELRQNYLGCQNLPWTMKLLRSTTPVTNITPSHTNASTITQSNVTRRRQRLPRH